MANTGIRRTDLQIQNLLDKMFKLQVEGFTARQIQEKLNLPVRTFEYYQNKLMDRIIADQAVQRREDTLYYKKICEEQLSHSLRIENDIATNEKVTPRTRMDAAFRKAEISMLIFRMHIETGNWLKEYNQQQIGLQRLMPASEITEEEPSEVEESERSEDVWGDEQNEHT